MNLASDRRTWPRTRGDEAVTPIRWCLTWVHAGLRRMATWWRVTRSGCVQAQEGLHIGARSRFWAPRGITIGRQCYIGREVVIETNARIGHYALIASRVAFVGRHDHEISRLGVPMRFGRWVGGADASSQVVQEAVVVEDDVWIGFGAVILSGVTIGRGAIVSAGAVVIRDVEPYTIVAGAPAKPVAVRFPEPADRQAHEAMMRSGRFEFSERGYEHWLVMPGPRAP